MDKVKAHLAMLPEIADPENGTKQRVIGATGNRCHHTVIGVRSFSHWEPGVFWASHQCDLACSRIERLVNLGPLPPTGFKAACFPRKIQERSAGPARLVAVLSD